MRGLGVAAREVKSKAMASNEENLRMRLHRRDGWYSV